MTRARDAADNATGAKPKIIDAKGDLVVGTAADTSDRLAVGSNGDTIVADSAATTGLRYQASQAAGKNYVINGAFDIWQRATSYNITSSVAYGFADRWAAIQDSTAASVASQVTTSLPEGFRYALKLQRNASSTNVNPIRTYQILETQNSIPLQNKIVTFSFWAKAGANYSSASSALQLRVATGTGTDQSVTNMPGGSLTGYAEVVTTSVTLTTSWQRFTLTSSTISSSATQVGFGFFYTPVGTAGADDSVQITGVQLEIGSVATNFTRAAGTLQGELAACQRYYQKSFSYATAPADGNNNAGQIYTTRQASSGSYDPTASVFLKVTMRTAPTVTLYNSFAASPAGQWSDGSTSGAAARAFSIGDNTFTLDNTDNAITAANQGIHYVASAEL